MTKQQHQPIFVRLLQATFRLRNCEWINMQQRQSIDHCIKALVDIARGRGISIPTDLESQVTGLLGKNALESTQRWLSAGRSGSPTTGKNRLSLLDISSRVNRIARQGIPLPPPPPVETDKTIIEGLQDIVQQLEQQLKPLVLAELSVLVDLLYRPECLFPTGTEARSRCSSGGFISKLISHTEKSLEEKEDELCSKVLETLKEMLAVDPEYDGKVCSFLLLHLFSSFML